MSKGLQSYPEQQRAAIATRRLIGNTRGCGFWGAKDYFDKKKMKYPIQSEIGKGQLIRDALANSEQTKGGFHMRDDNDRGRKGKLPRRKPMKRGGGRTTGMKLAAVWPS